MQQSGFSLNAAALHVCCVSGPPFCRAAAQQPRPCVFIKKEKKISAIPVYFSGVVWAERNEIRSTRSLAHCYIKFVVCELDWELGYGIDGDENAN